MKTLYVSTTWTSSHVLEVPDDWTYEGLHSLTEYDDLDCSVAELTDWEWREENE